MTSGEFAARPAAAARTYIPELDGLRAVSITLVVISHVGFERLIPGIFGVTVFFFISGYLITQQLLAEMAASQTIDLVSFYIRRALRLYPALIVMVAITSVFLVVTGASVTLADLGSALFYYSNYWELTYSLTPSGDSAYPFSVLWSLAIEEHYYLVFPVLVLLFGKRLFRFLALLVVLIAAVSWWRVHLASACLADNSACLGGVPWMRIAHGTDTRIDSILYGAVLAVWLRTSPGAASLRFLSSRGVFAAGVVLLLGSLAYRNEFFRDTWRYSVQGVGLFLCFPALLFGDAFRLRALMASRPAVALGRLSYSLYLWHPVTLQIFTLVLPSFVWEEMADSGIIPHRFAFALLPLVVAISLLLATLSYRFVERPMVTLRRRFGATVVEDGKAATIV